MLAQSFVILVAAATLIFAQGTILFDHGPSAHPLPVAASYVQAVENSIALMQAKWQVMDAACDPKAPFMIMYMHMTYGLRNHIRDLYFDDGERMSNFTVKFAGRYLQWLDYDAANRTDVVEVWEQTFDYGRSGKSSIMEDLYLGMNAHINYDLANIVHEMNYAAYKADYDRVNDILKQAMGPIMNDIASRYDPDVNSTLVTIVAPVLLQVIMGWRETSWLDGILLIASPLTRPVIRLTMNTAAIANSLPYKTYNVACLGASTRPERLSFCSAHHRMLDIE